MAMSTALQTPFLADLELTLELRSRVRRTHYAAPRPPRTRARSSAAAKAFRYTIVVHGGRCQWRQARTLDIFEDTSQRTLLPQCWAGERPSSHPAIEAEGSNRRGRLFQ